MPAPFDDRDLAVDFLLTEPRLVALAAADPLAARPRLCLADLAGRTLPDGTPAELEGRTPDRVADSGDVDRWSQTAGRPPLAGAQPGRLDLAQIFNLTELGSIIWFPPVSIARRHPRPGVVYRTASDLPPLTLTLAWPQDSRSPAVAAFVRTATAVAKDM
ncbi:LysR substrate-binding domain-containing protein [Streptomyces phaeochromogenes]|uniref:LysR substrate-binding domain-containing protein n=1 Tax=Streptomyces phaeochromogenes TaxID=1923 RepID=UPI0039A3DF0C